MRRGCGRVNRIDVWNCTVDCQGQSFKVPMARAGSGFESVEFPEPQGGRALARGDRTGRFQEH
jgi:hypothetical protein